MVENYEVSDYQLGSRVLSNWIFNLVFEQKFYRFIQKFSHAPPLVTYL